MAENGITPKQKRCIAALLSERTIETAAQRAKIGERTIYRWLSDPAFKQALLNEEAEAIDLATRQLIRLQTPAVEVIQEVLLDKEMPAAVRLRAAQTAFNYLLKLRELRNLEERLVKLEIAINR
jgi:hypothetical protein